MSRPLSPIKGPAILRYDIIGKAVLALLLLALFGQGAAAGDLRLSSIRIDLSDASPNFALTVTSASGEPTLIQCKIMAWSQTPAGDVFTPTDDILVNPPISEIAPNGHQLVRIGFLGKLQTEAERTYRLFVEEVPRHDRIQTHQIETYLKFSVPVFVASLGSPKSRLSAHLVPDVSGQPTIVVQNTGTGHERIMSYSAGQGGAASDSVRGLLYVLPGASMALPKTPFSGNTPPGKLNLMTDSGPLQLSLEREAR